MQAIMRMGIRRPTVEKKAPVVAGRLPVIQGPATNRFIDEKEIYLWSSAVEASGEIVGN